MRALAFPIPAAPPVTSATLFVRDNNLCGIILIYFHLYIKTRNILIFYCIALF
ncbi:Uncharacterised protein [Amycolatopsis camponoti]|uniref:Uncharacterized protein n=1 Tax=Amycolatopsis camponoti TaxID=2606593 RepID=A0A6I8M5U2_9PSEU|nr:Uncharacterised protein [Amycolatopsis camponoti]